MSNYPTWRVQKRPEPEGLASVENRLPVRTDELEPCFKWRSRDGEFHPIAKMGDRHLFMTFRMIWNNTMPRKAHVGVNINYYRFTGFYTPEYLKTAVVHIYAELLNRWDRLPDWMRDSIIQIRNYFDLNHPALPEGEDDE